MKTSTPKLHSIKFKNGGEARLLPESTSNFSRIRMGEWGEITARRFNGEPITAETLVYMLKMAQHEVMYDDD